MQSMWSKSKKWGMKSHLWERLLMRKNVTGKSKRSNLRMKLRSFKQRWDKCSFHKKKRRSKTRMIRRNWWRQLLSEMRTSWRLMKKRSNCYEKKCCKSQVQKKLKFLSRVLNQKLLQCQNQRNLNLISRERQRRTKKPSTQNPRKHNQRRLNN